MKKKKFYEMSLDERRAWISDLCGLNEEDILAINGTAGLTPEDADYMIENVIGTYALPLGIAQNFRCFNVAFGVVVVVAGCRVNTAHSANHFRGKQHIFHRDDCVQ